MKNQIFPLYIVMLLTLMSCTPMPVRYSLVAYAGTNGTISPSGSIKVNQGEIKTFSITPNAGYRIYEVIVDGVSVGVVTSYNFKDVSANHTISVSFEKSTSVDSFIIITSAGSSGTITPSGSIPVNKGENKAFSIVPNAGYRISQVLVDDVSVGAVNDYVFRNISASHTIKATFIAETAQPITYSITASAGPNGAISPSGIVKALRYESKTFTIVPDDGYRVADVKIDGATIGSITSYTFTQVTADHTMSASFEPNYWTSYTASSGLPSNDILSLAVDKSGALWVGTGSGASRYDGVSWTNYDIKSDLGNDKGAVYSIFIDDKGNKWFGTERGGVSKFDGALWSTYTHFISVYTIAEDSAGTLWFGGYGQHIESYDGSNFKEYETFNIGTGINEVRSIAVDDADNIWFGTNKGVGKFNGKSWVNFNTSNSGIAGNDICSIAIDGSGKLWFATENGASTYDGKTWKTFNTSNSGLISNDVLYITVSKTNDIWFGTSNGVSKFNNTSWTSYDTSRGLASNEVSSIVVDSSGSLWFGTYGGGISKFDGQKWTIFNKSTTAPVANEVCEIAVDPAGNKWFGTNGSGVIKFDGTTWTNYKIFFNNMPNLPHDIDTYVKSFAVDKTNNVWCVTSRGLIKFNGQSWTIFDISNYFLSSVSAVVVDQSGRIWLGGIGVSSFDGTTWTNNSKDFPGASVNTMAIDSSGNLWFGTEGTGVVKYDGKNWTAYRTSNSGLANQAVRAIVIDDNGNLWFGTSGGVSKYDGNTWTSYTTSNSGLANNTVSAIAVDNAGYLWFGTHGGVSKYDGNIWTTYNVSNSGLVSDSVWSIAIDSEGTKWFGTYDDGISKFSLK